MKPSPFRYFDPVSVDETVALLAEHGEDAKLLAGGQSLVPLMNLRLAAPEVVIDLNRVAGLAGARVEDGQLVIGAMTRHRDVAGAGVVRDACPMLAHAAGMIGYTAIRNRGTIGGSLVHGDPASEMPCVAVALDAELVALGPGGRRAIPARDFFISHFTTALEPSELLAEIRLPVRADGHGWEFLEFSRKSGDFAVAAVAVDVRRGGGARIGVGGVGEKPWRATEAEQALAAGLDAGAFDAAAASAVRQATGLSDGYRANVVGALTRRALATAVERIEE